MSRAERRWAVVPAAGRGERFGSRIPKQYTKLLGRPMLSWTLEALLCEPSIDGVMVAVAARDRRWYQLEEAGHPRVGCCIGGATRAESVTLALQALAPMAGSRDWVLVHDAARPCLARSDLRRLLAGIRDDAVGGLLAQPASDTLKLEDAEGRCARTLPREGVWRALTPQAFRYGLLTRALRICQDRERVVTDEASAVEALGLRPRLVRGRADNIKVTTREDQGLAEAVLRARAHR
jgi:2-C-methyl-D-erythritol 4-phosphate cytidylyltransferase